MIRKFFPGFFFLVFLKQLKMTDLTFTVQNYLAQPVERALLKQRSFTSCTQFVPAEWDQTSNW